MRDWADPIPEDQPKKLDEMVDELDEVNDELAGGPDAAAEGAERRESEERLEQRRRRGPDLST
ncbi:MAG TPA: hypothetical protein VFS16_16095 [Acidimicrobiia bacterium]|nr:hypothetical protein [Acidimicrobiia bacterium]